MKISMKERLAALEDAIADINWLIDHDGPYKIGIGLQLPPSMLRSRLQIVQSQLHRAA
jgi:hypothetical protein